MSERLTVVFDDDTLYRRLKVLAAENHVPLKRVVEDAVRAYLGPELPEPKTFDWDVYDRWQAEVELLNDEAETKTIAGARILNLPISYRLESEQDLGPVRIMGEEQTPYRVDP